MAYDQKQRDDLSTVRRSLHLRIDRAEDLQRAVELNEALWVATSAPAGSINCDRTFLSLLDGDETGRITCHEVREAIGWLLSVLADTSGIDAHRDSIRLEAIDDQSDNGRQVRLALEKMLQRLAKGPDEAVGLGEIRQIKADVEAQPVSGAGVVLPEAAADEDVRRFIADAIAVTAGEPHPSGHNGLAKRQLEAFMAAVEAERQWRQRGQLGPNRSATDIMPLAGETSPAYDVLAGIRGKVDQYFAQCEALALDERFVQQMGWTAKELEELDFDDPAVIEQVLRKAPLAKATPQRELRLDEPVNPFYTESAGRFRRQVAEAVFGEGASHLTAAQWQRIKALFAPHQQWLAERATSPVANLADEKLETYRDERFAEAVKKLIADSAEAAVATENICLVEKLLLYQTNLLDLANNFVSFPHLYDPDRRAMFEMGTLVMDGRRFNLAVRVDDRTSHVNMARGSNMYVMYVEISPSRQEPYEVAIPITSGGKGNLCLYKRGVFYDVAGCECDARVVQIIENPISLPEAMVSPFRRLGRLVTGKIESLGAKAEKKLDTQAARAMTTAASSPAKGTSGLAGGGMMLGAGVAIAALGSAVAYVTKTLSSIEPMTIFYSLLVAVALVMLPTSIVAFMKLSKRDLSAILAGSGWAINARMRLTGPQRRFFTQRPMWPTRVVTLRRVIVLALLAILLAGLIGAGVAIAKMRTSNGPQAEPPASSMPVDR